MSDTAAPRSHARGPQRALVAALAAASLSAIGACSSPPATAMRVHVLLGGSLVGAVRSLQVTTLRCDEGASCVQGANEAVRLAEGTPESVFALVPREGGNLMDRIEITVRGLAGTDASSSVVVTNRGSALFVPGAVIDVFIGLFPACVEAMPAQPRCSEPGDTCGSDGACALTRIERDHMPLTPPDAGADAADVVDVMDVQPDVPQPDVPPPPDAPPTSCVPACESGLRCLEDEFPMGVRALRCCGAGVVPCTDIGRCMLPGGVMGHCRPMGTNEWSCCPDG